VQIDPGISKMWAVKYNGLAVASWSHSGFISGPPPFPEIDIVGAMVIVWRVRGKIIRSVRCNIVRNNCAQCNAHTYEHTYSSLNWVLSHWAHFTVRRFIFVYVLLYACVVL